jgi:hypothetical protein
MNFDDGENPWRTSESYIQTFSFRGSADNIHISITAILLPLTLLFIVQHWIFRKSVSEWPALMHVAAAIFFSFF